MVLNNHSHVHVKIRKICSQLELISNMKLVTDLDNEFKQIRFANTLGYILIDYKKQTIFSLSHKITEIELHLIREIMLYIDWLETGERIAKGNRKKGIVKAKR